MKTKHNIILFGGSFDPIHNGHLAVAAYAVRQLDGDRMIFVPARRSPHKTSTPAADGAARLTMIRLAIAGHDGFEVSDCELRRPEPSYTLDTVLHFRRQFGDDAEIFWLVGADAIGDLKNWYRINELLDMCRLCIMYRGGMATPNLECLNAPLGPSRVARLQNDILQTPLIDVSSTDIRARLASGEPAAPLVPPPVLDYIHQNGLYSSAK